jgi:hypothetical protein
VQNQYPESRPAGSPSTVLLSLSRSGQMAILRDAHHLQVHEGFSVCWLVLPSCLGGEKNRY